MKLPLLFRQVHGQQIFNIWMDVKRPPIVRVIPQEPLPVITDKPMADSFTITIVNVRCWNDQGTMQFEAASPADLEVAQEWAKRHADTPPEAFKWYPQMASSK